MKTATVTAKIDPKIKASAERLAESLGISLSFVINQALLRFTQEEKVVVESYVPNKETIKAIREAEEDLKAGKLKTYSTTEELFKALEDL